MHAVHSPDGTRWEVGVHWVGRRVRDPGGRFRAWAAGRRERRARRRSDEAAADTTRRASRWDWLDPSIVDLPFELLDSPLGMIVAVGIFALLTVALWFVLPGVVLFLIGAVEILLVLLAAVLVFTWRTLARRPWHVIAVTPDGREHLWRVVGWRRAHRAAEMVALRIRTGTPPGAIAPDEVATA